MPSLYLDNSYNEIQTTLFSNNQGDLIIYTNQSQDDWKLTGTQDEDAIQFDDTQEEREGVYTLTRMNQVCYPQQQGVNIFGQRHRR